MSQRLDEIAIRFGTDKATQHPVGAHGYTPAYSRYFAARRLEALKFLEIGVGGGESIQTWLEYFPSARVFGLDKVCDTNPWNTRGAETHPRYKFIQGDQTDPVMWQCLIADNGKNWDIIIDDGGHFNDEVITTWAGMWPVVASGGLYCIEDIGVDVPGSIFVKPGLPRHLDFLRERIEKLNAGQEEIESIHFYRELVIIRKK